MTSARKTKDPSKRPGKLDANAHALILRLSVAGKTQAEIAQIVGVHQTRVGQVLATFGTDTRESAKKKLYAAAEKVADHALRGSETDVWAALELLDRTDTLPKKDRSSGRQGGNVLVVVGNPDPRALPPALTITQETEASPTGYTGGGALPQPD